VTTVQEHKVSFWLAFKIVVDSVFIFSQFLMLNGKKLFKLFALELQETLDLFVLLWELSND